MGWFIYSLFAVLLFILFSFGLYSIPDNLPQFALNWIKELDAESKLNIKATYLRMYLINLLLISVALLIYVFTGYLIGAF